METRLRSGSVDHTETMKEVITILKAFVRLTYEKPQVQLQLFSYVTELVVGMVYIHLAYHW